MGEPFAVQDEIAQRNAGALEPQLLHSEACSAAARCGPQAATSWELVAQGTHRFHQLTRATHLSARGLFRQACTISPELADAHLWLGRMSAGLAAYGWSAQPEADLAEGRAAALRAVRSNAVWH